MKPFVPLFKFLVRRGNFVVIDAQGERHTFGDGQGKPVVMKMIDVTLHKRLAKNPSLALGEGFMDGTLMPATGTTLIELLTLLMENELKVSNTMRMKVIRTIGRWMARWQTMNPLAKARRNVAHHYDLSDELFDLFLDRDRQYSCAHFAEPGDTLETAQARKKQLIARKLLLSPGQRVLDIGSGWGGLGLHLAREHHVDVTGITLSDNQFARSNARAAEAGLSNACRFQFRDYRDEYGVYDRVVSVGMFEHVGIVNYDKFFTRVSHLLNDSGVALIHSIGSFNRAGPSPAWMDKYIFPGAYVPTLSEVIPAVERSGLKIMDIEIWRLHYAETLRLWRENFNANRDAAREMYDERFCRMWEFYLTACEVGFRIGDLMVFQLQLAKQQDAVPLTRRYLFDHYAADTARQAAE
jgi:cyclopropane-fatty-acyl-phospholipid synthase